MPRPSHPYLLSQGVVTGLCIALLAGGLGTGCSPQTVETNPAENSSTFTSPEVKQPTASEAEVYWLSASGNEIKLLSSKSAVKGEGEPKEQLESILKELLAGPTTETQTTTIPEGTKLINIALKDDGIHVDLSPEFQSGGGTASMTGRLGQILYTATSLNPTASVWLKIDGQPLELLGGEGLIVNQPMTRKDFEENFDL